MHETWWVSWDSTMILCHIIFQWWTLQHRATIAHNQCTVLVWWSINWYTMIVTWCTGYIDLLCLSDEHNIELYPKIWTMTLLISPPSIRFHSNGSWIPPSGLDNDIHRLVLTHMSPPYCMHHWQWHKAVPSATSKSAWLCLICDNIIVCDHYRWHMYSNWYNCHASANN